MFKNNESIRTGVAGFDIFPQIIIKLLLKIDYKNVLFLNGTGKVSKGASC